MTRHHIAGGRDVPPGSIAAFVVDGRRVVVANVEGAFTIVDELCPHLSIPLSQGRLDGACITCAGHGSVFELPEGTVRRWMGRRPGFISQLLSGKPQPLRPFRLTVDDGELYLLTDGPRPAVPRSPTPTPTPTPTTEGMSDDR